jgi:ketosteroid isomerase-like protein
MSKEDNKRIAEQLLAKIRDAADPEEVAALFNQDVQFEIAGDVGALPWIGRSTGRNAVAAFIRDTRRLLERRRFDVHEILVSDSRAIIVGDLTTRINATGKVVESTFALILTISGGEITRFQMLEDSLAVSRAARP